MIKQKTKWCEKCERKQVRYISTFNRELFNRDVKGDICFACGYWKAENQKIRKEYLRWLNDEILLVKKLRL